MKLVAIFEAGFVDYTRDDDGAEDEQDIAQDDQQLGDDQPTDEFGDDQQPQDGEQEQQGDPDRQGDIRTVPEAHLVYKRKTRIIYMMSCGSLRSINTTLGQ